MNCYGGVVVLFVWDCLFACWLFFGLVWVYLALLIEFVYRFMLYLLVLIT